MTEWFRSLTVKGICHADTVAVFMQMAVDNNSYKNLSSLFSNHNYKTVHKLYIIITIYYDDDHKQNCKMLFPYIGLFFSFFISLCARQLILHKMAST